MNLHIANDNGNSEQDMFIGETQVAQPNVFARVPRLPNMDEVQPEAVLNDIHNNLTASVEGTIYYVGQRALKSGLRCRSIEVGVDNDKVTSDIVYVNTLAHVAGEAATLASRNGEDLDHEITVEADMATALPVSYYSRSNAEQFAKRFTGKTHHIIVYAGPREISVRLSFPFVKVIPEGVTAAHAFIRHPELYDAYNAAHPEEPLSTDFMSRARVLHIAIGEGTTEFPITHDGLIFEPDFITGTNNGNGHAIDRVIQEFKKVYGLLKFTRQDYSNVLRDPSHRYHETAMALLEPALEDEAEEILSMAKEVILRANNEVDIVAVYGGGSILMRPALEDRLRTFCNRAGIRVLYIDEEYAVPLEAMGLHEFVESDLFALLRSRAES